MLNQVILVGRLVKKPELKLTDSGRKITFITVAVPRGFKNANGEYDTDFVDCTLWMGIAENTAEYCKTGDVIGVKGRLQTRLIDNEDGTKYKKMEVIAERVTFLTSSRIDDDEIEDGSNNESKSVNSENSSDENVDNENIVSEEVDDEFCVKESEATYKKGTRKSSGKSTSKKKSQ